MKIVRIQCVRVVVKTRREAHAFLEKSLGLECLDEGREGCYSCPGGGPIIEIAEDPQLVVDPERGGYLYRHIGFEVASLSGAIARGLQHGLRLFLIAPGGDEKVVESPDDELSFSQERVVFVRDQDHNLWELVQRDVSFAALFQT
jgi:catechol 2,3-dioxygenase-like lactoylglutathione lyase family enzyme